MPYMKIPAIKQVILATLVVSSLYTKISLSEAKAAIEKFFTESRPTDKMPRVSSPMSFLDLFFFSRNIFIFSNEENVEYYLQTNTVSMG